MTRGEVWRVRLPSVPGHTQAGTRPAVIEQEDQATAALPTVFIVPFTGTLAALRFPGTVAVQPDELDPVTLDQIFAVLDKLTGR